MRQAPSGEGRHGFEALDNGYAAVDDVAGLQAICDSLGPRRSTRCCARSAFCPPRSRRGSAAGYRYELSILQAEFWLTQMLDAPVSGRIFFEQVIRDNLDIGRPDHVALIFDRRILNGRKRKTPGRFRTRVITDGVVPSLHADYKNAKIKQYHKQGRALRTETTINNPHDFGVTKRLTSLPDLRQLALPPTGAYWCPNHQPRPDPRREGLHRTHRTHPHRLRHPHRRYASATTVFTPCCALLVHRLLPHGFTNRELRTLTAPLLANDSRTSPPGR